MKKLLTIFCCVFIALIVGIISCTIDDRSVTAVNVSGWNGDDSVVNNEDGKLIVGDVTLQVLLGEACTIDSYRSLGAAAGIDLKTLTIILTANGEKDIKEVIDLSGNMNVNFIKAFKVASKKTWTIFVQSVDLNGVIIHEGTKTAYIEPNKTTNVKMDLTANYSEFVAIISPIKYSKYFVLEGAEVLMDGNLLVKKTFAPNIKSDTLRNDYIPTGMVHEIQIDVYGIWRGKSQVLFSGKTSVDVQPCIDIYKKICLKWKPPCDPPEGDLNLEIELCRGKVSVKGIIIYPCKECN